MFGTTKTTVSTPSGKIYTAGDRSIESRDLNFAIQSGLANSRHTSFGLRNPKTLVQWEVMTLVGGVLIKLGECMAVNRSSSAEYKLSSNQEWETDDTYAYIPFNDEWFDEGQGILESTVCIFIHPTDASVPLDNILKPQDIFEDHLTLTPSNYTFTVCKEDEEATQIPQCDCLSKRATYKIATLKMTKNSKGIFATRITSHCVNYNIIFDLGLIEFDIVNIEPNSGDIYMYLPEYPWRVASTVGNFDISDSTYQGTEESFPSTETYGFNIEDVYSISTTGLTNSIYLKIKHGLRKPEEADIVSVLGQPPVNTDLATFYHLFDIKYVNTTYGKRITEYIRQQKGKVTYTIYPYTYDESGTVSKISLSTSIGGDAFKYLKLRQQGSLDRGVLVLDWIRASNDPLEIEPPSEPPEEPPEEP